MSIGIKPADNTPTIGDAKNQMREDPWFIFQQEQQAWRQQQENQRQRMLNQQARQQAEAQMAGLQLDTAQLQLQHQQNASRLLQDLLNARFQTMLADQSGARTL